MAGQHSRINMLCIRATLVSLASVGIANKNMFSCKWVAMNGFFCVFWSWHSALYVFIQTFKQNMLSLMWKIDKIDVFKWSLHRYQNIFSCMWIIDQKIVFKCRRHRYQNMFSCMRIIDEKTVLQHLAKFDEHVWWKMCRVAGFPCTPASNGQADQRLLGSDAQYPIF